jgi:hypothetical protein
MKPNQRSQIMTNALASFALVAVAAASLTVLQPEAPRPPVVNPGVPGHPPADAVVLIGGADLSAWQNADGVSPAGWLYADGVATVNSTGSIMSREHFGDCQVHVEFATPEKVEGTGQERGNSGVYLMGRYEVQILDSFDNETYADGQCGAVYKQHPPLVNASRGPGQWQTYDIIFRGPRFDENGRKTSPGHVTVLHNGVLIQDRAELKGVTGGNLSPESAEPGPILLQDHGNPMRFRNVWVRRIAG